MRNPRGEVSGACTDTLNCHPGDVERERASQGHGHESHIIFASHFRTLGRSLLGEGQPDNGTGQRDSQGGRDTGTGIVRAFNAELATEMPSLSLRGVHNYIDSLPHPLDAPLYNSPLAGTNF